MVLARWQPGLEKYAIEPFLRRLGNQLLRQRDVFLGRETQAVKESFDFILGLFDSLADGHFAFAREERHLAHLAQVHPQRIIQRIELGLFVWLPALRLLSAVHLRLVDDLNVEVAENAINLRQAFSRDQRLGQRFVNVIERQIALFPRQSNQLFDLFAQVSARLALDRTEQLFGADQRRVRQETRPRFGMAVGAVGSRRLQTAFLFD